MGRIILALLFLPPLSGCCFSGDPDEHWTFGLSRALYEDVDAYSTPLAVGGGGGGGGDNGAGPLVLALMALPVALDIVCLPVALPHDLLWVD